MRRASRSGGALDRSWSIEQTLLLLVFVTTISGCAYVPLDPLSSQLTTSTLKADEQHLWKKSRALQHEIDISGLLFEDVELDRYLARVLERVSGVDLKAASLTPRVHVISDVNFDGYSFANGVIYIHTALLSRMENETQLATLLSRELAHVINRHALRRQRDRRVQADTLAWIGLGTSLVEGGGSYKLLVQAASLTSATGFHHLLETAADQKGLVSLVEAGYSPGQTPDFFQMTVDHLAEVHAQGPWGWFPFIPPAHMTARITGYRNLISTQYQGREANSRPLDDEKAFRRKMHGATMRQVELELAAGLFISAETSAQLAIESAPRDPNARILLGRALVGQRGKPIAGKKSPSIERVRESFKSALNLDRRNAVATRELGMSFYRKAESLRSPESTKQALQHFRRYLQLAPNAQDIEYTRGYIAELEAEPR